MKDNVYSLYELEKIGFEDTQSSFANMKIFKNETKRIMLEKVNKDRFKVYSCF